VTFYESQHQDVTIGLAQARSLEAARELARLPGALAVEPVRAVTARFSAGRRSRREALTGIAADARLQPAWDVAGHARPVPDDGLLLGSKLAELLGVRVGDTVKVEVLEGRRPVRELPVVGLVDTYLGTPAWVRIDALNRMMGERPAMSAAHLAIDPTRERELHAALKELPTVSGVTLRRAAVEKFQETLAESMLIFIGFFVVFSCALVFGITYNATRVSLSERARELATLRVLGADRLEVSYILLGEMALLVLLGLPSGCLVGYGIAAWMASRFETELFRVPVVIEDATLGLSVAICVAAAVLSALIVRSRLDRLDLIGVLKTRE
jgi:putative ABC transport system permease protein